MKKFLRSIGCKIPVVAATLAASSVALAEEATSGVTAQLVTPYITDGKTQILSVFTAGAVIVGAFFVWGLIKRAMNRSK